MLTAKQVPFTRRYRLGEKGPTAEASKRALGRMGLIPWADFDTVWDVQLERAFDKVDPRGGEVHGYDDARWKILRGLKVPRGLKAAGEHALDAYGRKLIQDEAHSAGDDDEVRVQKAIADWSYRSIANAARIGYNMRRRPYPVVVDPASARDSDCSATVFQAYGWARHVTKLPVPDPAKQGFSGYGNTDLYEDDHPKIGSPFRIGDLAHFHSSRHVILCIKPGTVKTAEWISHGSASGPHLLTLAKYSRYPEEFLFVVRPPLLEA